MKLLANASVVLFLPLSILFAISISPTLESNSTLPISFKYILTGSSADDPVRMYLKEMGNVELLSRVGEIEIAKRIESGKNKTTDAFAKSFISMESIFNFFNDYSNTDKQLRDFIDLDASRSIKSLNCLSVLE